jgi:hypothetical protein
MNLLLSCLLSKFSPNWWSFDHLFTVFQIKIVYFFRKNTSAIKFLNMEYVTKYAQEYGCDLELIVYNAV